MRPILLSVLLAASALAQNASPPAFEVASVKINQQFRQEDRATWLTTMDSSHGNLTMRNVNLTMIAAWAYRLQRPQISGPAWLDGQRYDILAKAGRPAEDDEMRAMLQALLAERFKLAAHRETRQMEVLALTLPKGGHKMKQSQVEGPPQSQQDPVLGAVVQGAELADLADDMSHDSGMPIVDMTGLKGRFDFTLNVRKYVEVWRSRMMSDPRPPTESEAKLGIMQDVLSGELGLRLEPRKAPVEVLVIDRVEKSPVAN